MYGVMLLLAIAGALWLTGSAGCGFGGDWDLVYRVTIWGVIGGIVGARLYHVVTSWNEEPRGLVLAARRLEGRTRRLGRDPLRRPRRRLHRRRSGASVRLFMDAVAPGLLLAAGDRPLGQLVEPGALRQADRRSRGGSRSTAGGRPDAHVPPDVPLRVHLEHHRRRRPAAGSTAASRSSGPRSSRSTSPGTRPSRRSRRRCGSTRRITSSVSGSTSGSRSRASSRASRSSSGGSSCASRRLPRRRSRSAPQGARRCRRARR